MGGREKEARKGIGKRGKEKGKRKKGGWLTRYDDRVNPKRSIILTKELFLFPGTFGEGRRKKKEDNLVLKRRGSGEGRNKDKKKRKKKGKVNRKKQKKERVMCACTYGGYPVL